MQYKIIKDNGCDLVLKCYCIVDFENNRITENLQLHEAISCLIQINRSWAVFFNGMLLEGKELEIYFKNLDRQTAKCIYRHYEKNLIYAIDLVCYNTYTHDDISMRCKVY